MNKVLGYEIGSELCRRWGLKGVKDMQINFPLRDVATVTLTRNLTATEVDDVETVLSRYDLVEREEAIESI